MDWKLPDIVFFSAGSSPTPIWLLFFPTVLGAIVGGLVVIASDAFWQRRKIRSEYIVHDYELFIALARAINDVSSIGSRHISSLQRHNWPLTPSSVMEPTVGGMAEILELSTASLATVRGKHANGLVHEIMELVTFRNIIVGANSYYRDLHTQVVELSAPFAELGTGMQLAACLDIRDPAQRRVVIEMKRADQMAKQLLASIYDFYQKAVDVSDLYNHYRDNHWRKKLRSIKLDASGIRRILHSENLEAL